MQRQKHNSNHVKYDHRHSREITTYDLKYDIAGVSPAQ